MTLPLTEHDPAVGEEAELDVWLRDEVVIPFLLVVEEHVGNPEFVVVAAQKETTPRQLSVDVPLGVGSFSL